LDTPKHPKSNKTSSVLIATNKLKISLSLSLIKQTRHLALKKQHNLSHMLCLNFIFQVGKN